MRLAPPPSPLNQPTHPIGGNQSSDRQQETEHSAFKEKKHLTDYFLKCLKGVESFFVGAETTESPSAVREPTGIITSCARYIKELGMELSPTKIVEGILERSRLGSTSPNVPSDILPSFTILKAASTALGFFSLLTERTFTNKKDLDASARILTFLSKLKHVYQLPSNATRETRDYAYFSLGTSFVDICQLGASLGEVPVFTNLLRLLSYVNVVIDVTVFTSPPEKRFSIIRETIWLETKKNIEDINVDWQKRLSGEAGKNWTTAMKIAIDGGLQEELQQFHDLFSLTGNELDQMVNNPQKLYVMLKDYNDFLKLIASQGLLLIPDGPIKTHLGIADRLQETLEVREENAEKQLGVKINDSHITKERKQDLLQLQSRLDNFLSLSAAEQEKLLVEITASLAKQQGQ